MRQNTLGFGFVACCPIHAANISERTGFSRKLASAVSNNCFYEIRRQLTYKQHHYGTRVELVDRWFPSSKTCSKCGHIQVMKLSQRIFECEKCDHVQDRDLNSAINLEFAHADKIRLA